ncbi:MULTISPECIES: sensor histidine kinase [Clostridia]|uniref:histidine kinase n=2 Tax=Clostridia TaxID=186801 RepID=A0A8I0A844_9CLOT|nr:MULTISPECIES: HAMP domain-containing sensor histidine kinase [Clostridia]MBC5640800.1 HAMP domain-containing histidine kinase [Clostridium lentum]MBC5655016.1 HAMP domain-containing histidine kinase [Blautia lenta]
MKKRKRLPIFLEFSIISSIIIVSIICVYSVVQLISMNMLTIEYEEEQIEKRYEELSYILSNIELKDNTLNDIIKDDDEIIRIYQDNYIKYKSKNDIWDKIPLSTNEELKVNFRYIDWDLYVVLDGKIEIENKDYRIQIVHGDMIFDEIMENYFQTLLISLFIGIILSIIGAIYLSKRFVGRLKNLSNTINEVKENGIKYRVEISNTNDEFDKVNILFNDMLDEVEEAFNEQSRFVSDASHELRTPLTALQGHLRMIKRWGKNDKERLEKSLDICISETERLTKIVGDLLTLSRCDNEIINLSEIEKIQAKQIILQIIEHYKILNNTTKFKLIMDENLMLKIKQDHLKQILIIFIDNAIKYNDKDECVIDINIFEKNENILFNIRDNGKGIPKDEIPYILNRFYKVDKSRKNNNSFGLGLSIADKIISLYGGRIKIYSEEGIYTEIVLKIKNEL